MRILWLILWLILFCPLVAVGAGQGPPALLRPQAMAWSRTDDHGGGRRQRVDRTVLARMARGIEDRVRLEVGGQPVVLRRERLRSHGRATTWVGRDRENRTEAVLTLGPDYFFGRVVRAGRIFVYRPDPVTREMVVEERDPANAVDSPGDALVPAAAAAAEGGAVTNASVTSPTALAGSPDDGTVIDVMVLYSSGILAGYGSVDLVNTRIQHLLDVANAGLINSGINTRLSLVHSEQVNYDDAISDDTALNDLTYNQGVFAGVEDLRTQYGADQVTLLRVFTGQYCGLAWIYTGDARYAYAVVRDGSLNGYYCSDTTYAHEFGHNMGCGHERGNGGGYFDYSYGYQFQGTSGNWHRTIMAYNCSWGCPEVVYFSNPLISYDGVPTGIDPGSANAADNAQTINNTRVSVAAYRTSIQPDLVPSIRSHDFGVRDIGLPAATVAVQLQNQGSATLAIGAISGPASPFARISDQCSNQQVAPNDSCSLTLSFAPTAPGTFSSTVSIPSNDPDEPLVTIILSGQGQSQDPWISLNPDSLRFSALAPGATQDRSLVVTNRGLGNLVIGQVAAVDPLDLPFSLLTDSCTGATLATGETCQLTVRYAPRDRSDTNEDTFSLPSNAANSPLVTVPVQVRPFPWVLFMPAILGAGQSP